MPDEQPSRTLAVVLGASTFPNAPKLAEGRAFYISAADVKEYLCDSAGLALPRRNVLSLFDDSRSPSDQLVEIAGFLTRRALELKAEGIRVGDLFIYYVGHGLFTRGDQTYCLAIRSTNEINEGATSIRASDLAGVVKENAAFLRRYLIFDCCFAASIHKEFQSGALTAARVQLAEEFPERGTALLCSSNAHEPSLAPRGLEHTMFSNALLKALRNGREGIGARLSFSELGDLIKENLRTAYPDSWVRPEVHSPDQREGDIASIPIFPNPAFHPEADRAAEAAALKAAQIAAEEQAREKARKVELDRLARQQAEADARANAEADAAAHDMAQKAEQERIAQQQAETEKAQAADRAQVEAANAARLLEMGRAAAAEREKLDRWLRERAEADTAQQNAAAERNAAGQTATFRDHPAVKILGGLLIFATLVIGGLWLSHSPDKKPQPSDTAATTASQVPAPTTQDEIKPNSANPAANKAGSAKKAPPPAANDTGEHAANAMIPSANSNPAITAFNLSSRFTIGGPADEQTVLDTQTGLMWMRKDHRNIEGKIAANWDEAMAWADKIDTQSYGGYSDWKVPTIAQYRTINTSKSDREVFATIFEKTESPEYWSSNTPSQYVASYMSFDLKDGGWAVSGQRTMAMNVRLVRSNATAKPRPPSKQF